MDEQTKERVAELRHNGLGYRQIADTLGIHRNSVRDYCRKNGYAESPEEQAEKRGAKKYAKGYLITGRNGRFEYIGGYTNCDGFITVRCLDCGAEFSHGARALRDKDPTITCQQCKESERAEREKKRQEEIKNRREIREQQRWSRAVFNQQSFSICPQCNAVFYGARKYCSIKCRLKYEEKKKEIARRLRIGKADNTISLTRLYQRDNGMCYICGGLCDWNDKETKDGAFIAGNRYPSIDHVIPLARGGAHSWGNVRLAHRICNSLKGANIP